MADLNTINPIIGASGGDGSFELLRKVIIAEPFSGVAVTSYNAIVPLAMCATYNKSFADM
jgi:hypothetical protein